MLTAGAGTGLDLQWQYWNGTAWANLESVGGFTDETNHFTKNGSIYWSDPSGWAPYSQRAGPDLYYVRAHLPATSGSYTRFPRESRITTDILLFQYCGDISAAGQEFRFAAPVPTAVRLMSFSATPGNGSVTLEWQTGSELDNLGFHVYRGPAEAGPWTRLTSSLIPGLGSSPLGQAYSWLDSGLTNGTTYYYRLEDVDTASTSTFHGPVSAVPEAVTSLPPGSEDGGEGGGGDGAEGGGGEPALSSCPSWVLSAAPDAVAPTCTRHGDPESVSLDRLSRDASSATLELRTGGFWALHDATGTVRVFVPGLEFPSDPRAPALPLRRALVEAVVGKGVELVSAEAHELRTFRELRPSAVGRAEVAVGRDGTVRPARRALAAPLLTRGPLPREVARLAGTAFQGDRKSAVLEITPVRYSGSGLVLAGRVRVTVAFTGVADGESGTGGRSRSLPRKAFFHDVLAQLYTSRKGLHAVRFEELFPGRPRGLSTALLRLQRQGEGIGFHVEPRGSVFGPGSTLFFYADRTASSLEYSPEVAYELVRTSGVRMATVSAPPLGAPFAASSTGFSSFETNRIYQPGLLEAKDLWLWEYLPSGARRSESFALSGVATAEPARLTVFLQGGSESGQAVDHHVELLVNGALVGETSFAGKRPQRVDVQVPASVLEEGVNELEVVNVGDTGVASGVFLDRFEIAYPQVSLARHGVFEGAWAETGMVEVAGLAGPAVILRDSGLAGPEGSTTVGVIADSSSPAHDGAPRNDGGVRWLTGFEAGPGSVRFQAEAGYRYLVVSPEGL
ncbi:MAG TPA: fibronectin type III domain-containing protein, partial [Vicinamibacteria bacterium]|nr:fibronectin type III domain-containing protein [Vicinamibacteria bacterium]